MPEHAQPKTHTNFTDSQVQAVPHKDLQRPHGDEYGDEHGEENARGSRRIRSKRSADGRRELGARGENIAARYLSEHGYTLLERNWRPEPGMRSGLRGELDIIARQGRDPRRDDLVIVEVKTRVSLRYGPPAEAVTPHKLAQIRALTNAWLAAHHEHAPRVRIDVISVHLRPGSPAYLRHHTGVSS